MAAVLGAGVRFVKCGEEPEAFIGPLDLKRALSFAYAGHCVHYLQHCNHLTMNASVLSFVVIFGSTAPFPHYLVRHCAAGK